MENKKNHNAPKNENQAFFCNLTIRSMIKNIDDMTFKCPINWSVRFLREFIEKYDQKAIHTYKLESWTLFYGGRVLSDHEIIKDIVQKRDISENFVFMINIKPTLQTSEENKKKKEIDKEITLIKKSYIENELLEDYHRKLHFLVQDTPTNETNISNLPFLSSIPLMNPTFGERVQEIKKKKDSEKIFDMQKDTSSLPRIDLNVANDPEYRFFKWKLITKLFVFYFFFLSLTKSNLSNFYHYLFSLVLVIYYYIQLKDHERKIKTIQNNRINEFITTLAKKMGNEKDNILPEKENQNKENELEKIFNSESENNKTKDNIYEVSFAAKYYYIISEFVICFIYSFFPTWYVELYTESQSEDYKKIAESISKKKVEVEEPQKKLNNLYMELEKKKEELNDLKEKLNDLKSERKDNQEEIKEEESIDPTDNIIPENFKLIQKLQYYHNIEMMKEKFEALSKQNNNNNEGEDDEEDYSITSDCTHDIDFKRIEKPNNKKKSKSLDQF